MASVSISHLVIFIASLLVAATVAGALVTGVDRISGSVTDRSLDTSEEVRTDLTIISDAGSDAVYNESGGNGTVTVLVKNTGSLNLDATADQVDVLVDGAYVGNGDVTVTSLEGEPLDWRTGSVVRIEIATTLDAGDHRVQVTANGDEEVLRFRV
ncbi:flagellin [Salinarchaeum sp. Harcht-Bsk1]|uniref:CARDB domain-containing protein n=1 Tax=Salinarchaeum sp. Harcht-Bsk1 TaxID=1333523 RepID=UPI0003423544|nr:CARDB domain-containing protein [Salinarchaeum sp. Harcht-Bsk1]AGN02339.1 flagellin [Salinarchaeum sp. Harcht-Bsk1]